ncbi:MAG: hypothetical protein QOH61_576 [Chloroflexota bacterium]|nr:hypothetical protein [Chloroflexota bacterium]
MTAAAVAVRRDDHDVDGADRERGRRRPRRRDGRRAEAVHPGVERHPGGGGLFVRRGPGGRGRGTVRVGPRGGDERRIGEARGREAGGWRRRCGAADGGTGGLSWPIRFGRSNVDARRRRSRLPGAWSPSRRCGRGAARAERACRRAATHLVPPVRVRTARVRASGTGLRGSAVGRSSVALRRGTASRLPPHRAAVRRGCVAATSPGAAPSGRLVEPTRSSQPLVGVGVRSRVAMLAASSRVTARPRLPANHPWIGRRSARRRGSAGFSVAQPVCVHSLEAGGNIDARRGRVRARPHSCRRDSARGPCSSRLPRRGRGERPEEAHSAIPLVASTSAR